MKYKITKTDLQIDNNLHSEGSEVELTNEQTKGIEDYLIPIESNLSRRSPKDEAGKNEKKKGAKK
jgi:hypothetical protein